MPCGGYGSPCEVSTNDVLRYISDTCLPPPYFFLFRCGCFCGGPQPCMRANWCLDLLVQRRLLSRYQPIFPAPRHDTHRVFLIGDPQYTKGVQHWANHTSQAAKCVVEPGTPVDVGIIVKKSFFSQLIQTVD